MSKKPAGPKEAQLKEQREKKAGSDAPDQLTKEVVIAELANRPLAEVIKWAVGSGSIFSQAIESLTEQRDKVKDKALEQLDASIASLRAADVAANEPKYLIIADAIRAVVGPVPLGSNGAGPKAPRKAGEKRPRMSAAEMENAVEAVLAALTDELQTKEEINRKAGLDEKVLDAAMAKLKRDDKIKSNGLRKGAKYKKP